MSAAQIALLGAIAGFTIYLGLPLGRLRAPMPKLKALLSAIATGILIFLLWDVLTHAWAPIDTALGQHQAGSAIGNALVLLATFGVGLIGLLYSERWLGSQTRKQPTAHGPGTMAASELRSRTWHSNAGMLALTIAVGIGLHNFAEGLAIGNSAAAGQLGLAVLLIVGFGLHNATEGFGIVAPLTGSRPSWGYLALLGLIGGGPTFLGTLVGQYFVSEILSIAFLGLAGGSILYVVIELLAVARKTTFKAITTWGVFVGIILGFATDAVVILAGA
jgi:ZIP family zinc transporter